VILGGGTGGTMTANRLHRRFGDEAEVHVVDRDDRHVYQPGLLFVPFGLARAEEIVRPRRRQLRSGIVFHENEIASVSIDDDDVVLDDGTVLPYDVLVVATGVHLQPEETEGLTGPGWNERVFTFYEPEGADALRGALARFAGGRLVLNLVDMPIKCPVAPLEFAFLADWYLRQRGARNRTELVYSTPLDGAFTKPVASEHLAGLLAEKEIELVTEFNAGEVDGVGGTLTAYDGRELDFDLLVTIPLHGGAEYVERSPASGMRSTSSPRTSAPCRRPRNRTCSRSATPPIYRRRRRDRSRISKPRYSPRTSLGISRARNSTRATTGTRTASSRPASTKRC
jgi:sulfide:quinone oxidoreductase